MTIFFPSFRDLRPNSCCDYDVAQCVFKKHNWIPSSSLVIIRYTRKSQSSTQKDRLPSAPPECSWLLISSTILNYKEKGFAVEAMLFGIKKDSSFLLPPPPSAFHVLYKTCCSEHSWIFSPSNNKAANLMSPTDGFLTFKSMCLS